MARVTRNDPLLVSFLLDQSGSMSSGVDGFPTAAKAVATIVNGLLEELVTRSFVGEDIRDYFFLNVYGYGGQGWIMGPNVKLSETWESHVQSPLGKPEWVQPVHDRDTPMVAAFTELFAPIEKWCLARPNSVPPLIVNVTDGQSTDGDPSKAAHKLTSLSTNNGNVTLFNFHLSSSGGNPIEYPGSDSGLTTEAKTLFDISSPITEEMKANFSSRQFATGAKGFCFNSPISSLVPFLELGTNVQIG